MRRSIFLECRADLDPHQQAGIASGHAESIPFLDVLPPQRPIPAHPSAPVQGMLEASPHEFRPRSSQRRSSSRRSAGAVVVRSAPGLMNAAPRLQAAALRSVETPPGRHDAPTPRSAEGSDVYARGVRSSCIGECLLLDQQRRTGAGSVQ